jgi:hypothetical protein
VRKGFRQFFSLFLLILVTSIYLNGTRIFTPGDENGSYLSNYRYSAGNNWNRLIFGGGAHWGSMTGFIRLTQEADNRRNYGLMNRAWDEHYRRAFSRVAASAIEDLENYHINSVRGKLVNGVDKVLGIQELLATKSTTVAVAGILAAAYTGRTLRYRLGDDLAVESRTGMNSSEFKNQYVGWSSKYLRASIGSTYEGGAMSVSVRKEVAAGVSVNYDKSADHSVGVGYSVGF